MYYEICQNCFRFLGFRSCAEVDRLTLKEYDWLMEAHDLRQIDLDYRANLVAYLSVTAGATNKNGKPVYKNFKQFYDYEAALKEIRKPRNGGYDRFAKLKNHMKRR